MSNTRLAAYTACFAVMLLGLCASVRPASADNAYTPPICDHPPDEQTHAACSTALTTCTLSVGFGGGSGDEIRACIRKSLRESGVGDTGPAPAPASNALEDKCLRGKMRDHIVSCSKLLQSPQPPLQEAFYRTMRAYALVDLAKLHRELGLADAPKMLDEVLDDTSRAIGLYPSDTELMAWAFEIRADAELTLRRYDQAITDATHAVMFHPTNRSVEAGAFAVRGMAHCAKRDNWNAAADDLEQAERTISLDMDQHECRGGALFLEIGSIPRKRLAITELDAALQVNPRNEHALLLRGLARKAVGASDHDDAMIAAGDKDIAAAKAIDPAVSE